MNTKTMTRMGFLLALATLLSLIPAYKMLNGGSVTFGSMLPVVLIGYYYGPKYGLLGGFIYGLIQYVTGPYFFSVAQVIIDYGFAFTALGLGSFITTKSKYRLYIVYFIGVLGRFIFACISGYVFFGEYAPEGVSTLYYTLTYNASYIVPEFLITLVIIIPVLKKYIDKYLNA